MGEYNEKEIRFYESKEVVLGPQRVTLRATEKENDKYDNYKPGDQFTFKIVNDFNREEIKRGVILGHWKLPFALIPTGFFAGEAYELEIDSDEDQRSIIEWLLRTRAKNDLTSYSPITDLSEVHILAYSPLETIDEQNIQRVNENPEEWLERCGDSVFGHIENYNSLKECK